VMPVDHTYRWTATQVRRDFQHLRTLMRMADKVMRTSTDDTDLSEEGEIGQLALEMAGCAHSFLQWIESEQEKRRRDA